MRGRYGRAVGRGALRLARRPAGRFDSRPLRLTSVALDGADLDDVPA
jgi:hypothetical protein